MEWLSAISGVLTSSATGGVFGLIGSVAGAWMKSKALKSEREFKQLEWAHEDKLHF